MKLVKRSSFGLLVALLAEGAAVPMNENKECRTSVSDGTTFF